MSARVQFVKPQLDVGEELLAREPALHAAAIALRAILARVTFPIESPEALLDALPEGGIRAGRYRVSRKDAAVFAAPEHFPVDSPQQLVALVHALVRDLHRSEYRTVALEEVIRPAAACGPHCAAATIATAALMMIAAKPAIGIEG